MADSKTIISEAEEKMDMAAMYLDEALAHIRAGKADVRLLDGIRVDSYGSMVPKQMYVCWTASEWTHTEAWFQSIMWLQLLHLTQEASPSSRGTRACSA